MQLIRSIISQGKSVYKVNDAGNYAIPIIFTLLMLFLWEIVVIIFDIPKYLLPAPRNIALRLRIDVWLFLEHTIITLFEALAGFIIASMAGIFVAILMASSSLLERIIYPYAVVAKVIPIVAIAPLLMFWFGFGLFPKIIVAALISFFPIVVNTVKGLKSADTQLRRLMKSLSASPFQTFVKVQLPFSLPYIFAAFRIAITLSVVGAIVGELVGADRGLGYLIMIAQAYLDAELMFASVIMSSVLGIILFLVVGWVERRVLKWHQPFDFD